MAGCAGAAAPARPPVPLAHPYLIITSLAAIAAVLQSICRLSIRLDSIAVLPSRSLRIRTPLIALLASPVAHVARILKLANPLAASNRMPFSASPAFPLTPPTVDDHNKNNPGIAPAIAI